MSGHSKWKNIMHKKEKTDAQRAKIFTKIGREISMAVKEGGPDPVSNATLKDLIAKAKSNNVPNDNIERVIKKAAGGNDGETYEVLTYEGYGPSGVAVYLRCVTDNRNRTAGDLRHYFDKCGGNLGQTGSVNWMFEKKGVIVIDGEDVDEDQLMEDLIEADILDIVAEEGGFTVYTPAESMSDTNDLVISKKYNVLSAEVAQVPNNYTEISEEDGEKMQKLLDMLDDNDDVTDVWHNWDN
ncbi:MAG: YebC/PmpR family DNA-binding transcriptional regulator [Clostridia bacterium]|nr:YebC/PmpR family DNA-binding transcriptional regulator [Clostridia bacterium]MBQ5821289.1 YebC/PmpR family DNA-binding transcriptional regulator [Clostridia bacterium]